MKTGNATLAIYGIRDIEDKEYPVLIHDHNLTLFRNGKVEKHLQLERVTRRKYDYRFPRLLYELLAEEKLLKERNLDLVFVDHMMGRSFQNNEGNIRFEAPLNYSLSIYPEKGRAYFMGEELDGYAVNHELAHVFSNLPFWGPFKENSLHIHFDGGASKSNFSAWVFRNGKMQLHSYHWDLKYLSALYNANALNFGIIGTKQKDQNSLPGKFMGFASYGRYDKELEEWLKAHDFFQSIWKNKSVFFKEVQKEWNIELHSFDQKNRFIQDVAATVQSFFERELHQHLQRLQAETGTDYLYYSGGSALNIKANTMLVNRDLFREVYIPPCTNDSGLSIGAGALVEWLKHGSVEQEGPYLNNWGLDNEPVSYNKEDIEYTARLLMERNVIGVCNGPGESGPRALGNRSILALADSGELARYVSMRLKGREWYRPVAPVMLQRNLEYFTGKKGPCPLARFMLMDFTVLPEKQQELEGVVHVDGTSRIQTLESREANPFLFDLLTCLDEHYAIRALINTSFNAKGRPIVHTLHDAQKEASEMGIHYIVVQGKLMEVTPEKGTGNGLNP